MTDTNVNPFEDNNEGDNVDPIDYIKTKFPKGEGENVDVDWDAVAKGKYESDRHIARLEKEMADLRKIADQGMALKEFYEAVKSNPPGNSVEPTIDDQDSGDTPPAATQAPNVEEMVQEAIRKAEQDRALNANNQAVISKLNEVWGQNASTELRKAASSLGMSVQDLQNMGQRSPQALFKLLGVEGSPQPTGGTRVPTSTVNVPSSRKSGVRNWSYYNELRKSNPNEYAKPKVQAQEMRDAIELGAAFYE